MRAPCLTLRTLALALAVTATSALHFTEPSFTDATVDRGSTITLHWTSNSPTSNDPDAFSIYLAPHHPSLCLLAPVLLADHVLTTEGQLDIRIPCDAHAATGYRIIAKDGTEEFAQTDIFALLGDSCVDPVDTVPPVCVDRHSSSSSSNEPVSLPSTIKPRARVSTTMTVPGRGPKPAQETEAVHSPQELRRGLAGESGDSSSSCPKKRPRMKRHSDGGQPAPFRWRKG